MTADVITFLDARGRQYYLPAFMLLALEPPEHDTGNVETHVIQTIMNVARYRLEFDSNIDPQQAAIARFLRYMIDEEDAFFPTGEKIERWAGGCDNGLTENAVEVAYRE